MPPVQHRYPRVEKEEEEKNSTEKRKKMESFSVKKLSVLYEVVSQRIPYLFIHHFCIKCSEQNL